MTDYADAIAIALGASPTPGDSPSIRLRGAQNDYNAKGKGSTMARRVLRGGHWEWLSAPASRGRYLAGDRHDTQYGSVWIGEIVATYTLGGRGKPEPDFFHLVIGLPEQPLLKLPHAARRDGQYTLSFPDSPDTLVIPSSAWR